MCRYRLRLTHLLRNAIANTSIAELKLVVGRMKAEGRFRRGKQWTGCLVLCDYYAGGFFPVCAYLPDELHAVVKAIEL